MSVRSKRFDCVATEYEGNRCIRVDAYEDIFLLSVSDAIEKYMYLERCLADEKFPVALTLTSTCPKVLQTQVKAFLLTQNDTNELFAALGKVLTI
jgi:hypothetical protein